MYQRIFVPVDDSESSHLSEAEACKLAKEVNAQVRLVHVIDLAQFGWGGTEFLDAADLQKSIKESGEQILAQAQWRAHEAGIEPVTHIIESWGDKIAAVLLDDAREWNADLIVMGTHGVGGLLHLMMGSVAEGVLKQTDVPVLLVRNPGK